MSRTVLSDLLVPRTVCLGRVIFSQPLFDKSSCFFQLRNQCASGCRFLVKEFRLWVCPEATPQVVSGLGLDGTSSRSPRACCRVGCLVVSLWASVALARGGPLTCEIQIRLDNTRLDLQVATAEPLSRRLSGVRAGAESAAARVSALG
jgi:hypothetical protein